jgi:peptidoglycan/xylan/chitin deacetylase (PgdA/CDA1 family)
MKGLGVKFKRFSGKSAAMLSTKSLLKATGLKLIHPFYHTISNKPLLHIQHLYPVKNSEAFKADLDFLLQHFAPLGVKDFMELSRADSAPPKPSFLLSFDDGLSEFYDVIAPILLQKGVPAICFLNSAFIDNRDLFYRYKASLLVDAIMRSPALVEQIIPLTGSIGDMKKHILSISYSERAQLDQIAEAIGSSFANYLSEQKPYLTSEQIVELKNKGFYFGAHSVDHPEYQYLNLEEQIRQTKESVEYVCNTFSLDYKLFSFPFTDYKVSKTFFDRLNAKNIIDFTFGSAGLKEESIQTHYQRIPFEVDNMPGKQILHAELLYYAIKKMLGKHTMLRND